MREVGARLRMMLLVFLGIAVAACTSGSDDGSEATSATSEADTVLDRAPTASPAGKALRKIDLWTGPRPELRGVNIHQARAFEEVTLFDGSMEAHYVPADFDRLADLGANYVNISHPGIFDERPPYRPDPTMTKNLDALIEMIGDADMFAVISFRTGPGRSELTFIRDEAYLPDPWFSADQIDESVWESDTAQRAWVEMWEEAALRYRDNPIVVGYDLMVEPNSNEVFDEDNPDVDLWDPDEFFGRFGGTSADWNQLYPRIVAAIRGVDPDTPILIGSNGYSAADWLPWLEPVDEPNIVYSIHQYEPFSYTHQEPGDDIASPDAADQAAILEPADRFAAEHDAPVAVNEMGAVRYAPGVAEFVADQLDLYEQRGWNHALWALLPVDYPGGDAFDYRVDGEELHDVLRDYWGRNELRPSTVTFSTPRQDQPIAGTDQEARRAELTAVEHWLYLIDVNLDEATVSRIEESGHDMVVLDFIPSEQQNTDYPMDDVVNRLHEAEHPKLVLAYVDIGEAEDYRTYWREEWDVGDPDWIVAADPDGWEGNFPVAYWREEWQEIWLGNEGLVAAIVAAGFDGVYLDWVEAYDDDAVREAADEEGVDAVAAMEQWVNAIAARGRAVDPTFLVIGQNAAELAAQSSTYREAIDAVAQEQVWFDGGADNDPPGDCPLPATEADIETAAYEATLRGGCLRLYEEFEDSTLHVSSEWYQNDLIRILAEGLPVFTADYARQPANVRFVEETSRRLGFVPFVGVRSLDEFVPAG